VTYESLDESVAHASDLARVLSAKLEGSLEDRDLSRGGVESGERSPVCNEPTISANQLKLIKPSEKVKETYR